MTDSTQFPFIRTDKTRDELGFVPKMPIVLSYQGKSIQSSGLLDTGASVNVLPFQIGIELGAIWENATVSIQLTGNLAQYETRVLIVSAIVSQYNPVKLVFAWTKASEIPLILGQVNFFMNFDVCFYRSQLLFEVHPKKQGEGID